MNRNVKYFYRKGAWAPISQTSYIKKYKIQFVYSLWTLTYRMNASGHLDHICIFIEQYAISISCHPMYVQIFPGFTLRHHTYCTTVLYLRTTVPCKNTTSCANHPAWIPQYPPFGKPSNVHTAVETLWANVQRAYSFSHLMGKPFRGQAAVVTLRANSPACILLYLPYGQIVQRAYCCM